MTVYRVKDWGRFQHYRDRRPPWIKLYVEVIDQYDETGAAKKFHSLPDSAKLTFFAVICLASRYGGTIPNADPAWLRAQLGIETVSLEPLIAAGYIVADNGASNDASTGASNLAHNPLDPDIDREKSQITPPPPLLHRGAGLLKRQNHHRKPRHRQPLRRNARGLTARRQSTTRRCRSFCGRRASPTTP